MLMVGYYYTMDHKLVWDRWNIANILGHFWVIRVFNRTNNPGHKNFMYPKVINIAMLFKVEWKLVFEGNVWQVGIWAKVPFISQFFFELI